MENRNITTKIIVCSYDELNEEEKKLIDCRQRGNKPVLFALLSLSSRCCRPIIGRNRHHGKQSGKCRLPVRNLRGTDYSILCQLSISQFARRGVGYRRSNQRGFHRPPHSTLWCLPAGNSRNRGTLQPADAAFISTAKKKFIS